MSKVQRVIDGLKKLALEKEISERIDKRGDLDKKQELLKSDNLALIGDLLKDYDGALEMNKELEKPIKLLISAMSFRGIKVNYNKVLENIDKNVKRKTISEIQNNAKVLISLLLRCNK